MYSAYNEGKSVVAEIFIRALKNKIFKHMTAISENALFDALDDIVDKYNNIVHRAIKISHIGITGDSYSNTMKIQWHYIQMKKILNLKLMITLGFQNIKTFLLKDIVQIGQKKFLLLSKLKIQFLGYT